ncbi:ASCH domain-containing protein [Georgenia wangjunii]|uniref:ASCH domain-containing protein n=1 Tax=Georgenia wangjunii TaxID=3117730 RepID=UPI002F26CE96
MDNDAAQPGPDDFDGTPAPGPGAGPAADVETDADQDAAIEAYWAVARKRTGINRLDVVVGQAPLSNVVPPAWAFGGTPEEADDLLALVLAGQKTATTSARWEYDAEDVPLPALGDLSIILDGQGRPQALISTTAVEVVPFGEVGEEHAAAEGEGDGSLETWRRAHEAYFREHRAEHEVTPDMPVVLERFTLLYPRVNRAGGPVAGDGTETSSAGGAE